MEQVIYNMINRQAAGVSIDDLCFSECLRGFLTESLDEVQVVFNGALDKGKTLVNNSQAGFEVNHLPR